MSAETDRHDQDTLAAAGRNPGIKRKSPLVTAAAVSRLIRAGLVKPPATTNGKLHRTPAGEARLP